MSRTAFLKAADAVAGSLLCRMAGCLASVAVDNEKTVVPSAAQLRRILILRPGGMGDMILLLPVIRILRNSFPDAVIDLVCERRNLEVLTLADLDCNALPYDGNPARFIHALRSNNYDVALDSEQFHHFSALFALASAAPVRIGFKINPRRNPLYTHLIDYSPSGPEGSQFMKLLTPLGLQDRQYTMRGTIADSQSTLPMQIQDRLDNLRVDRPLAVVHIGASTVYKRWAPERFGELVHGLTESMQFNVALVGEALDVEQGDRIVREIDCINRCVSNLAGQLNISQTVALLRQAGLFVGTDSGLGHLAVALGGRTVTLFGPSDHLKWGTQEDGHAIVRQELPCAPCFIFGYHKPCRSIACMSAIQTRDVLNACRRVVGGGSNPRKSSWRSRQG